MFLRTHRVGQSVYSEALESYRDPVTSKPKHRCIARWPADQPFAVALGKARFTVERDRQQVAGWQAIIDGTVQRSRRHQRDAPKLVKCWQARLVVSTTRLAGLEAVHVRAPGAEAEVQAATEAARQAWDRAIPPQFTVPATLP